MNEAETCRRLVRPKLEAAGWSGDYQHFYSEQISFTYGRIITPGGKVANSVCGTTHLGSVDSAPKGKAEGLNRQGFAADDEALRPHERFHRLG